MERDKKATEERLSLLLATIESERSQEQERLDRILQEIATLRTAISTSADERKTQILELKHTYKTTTEEYLLQERQHLDAIRQLTEMQNEYWQRFEEDARLCLNNIDKFDQEFGEGKC